MNHYVSPILHPSTGLEIVPFAFILGVVVGALRATLDRALMNPLRISRTMQYHVGFTAMITANGLLLLFWLVAHLVIHRGAVTFFPFVWATTLAYGSAVGYGSIMDLYRKLYLRKMRGRAYEDDEG